MLYVKLLSCNDSLSFTSSKNLESLRGASWGKQEFNLPLCVKDNDD